MQGSVIHCYYVTEIGDIEYFTSCINQAIFTMIYIQYLYIKLETRLFVLEQFRHFLSNLYQICHVSPYAKMVQTTSESIGDIILREIISSEIESYVIICAENHMLLTFE